MALGEARNELSRKIKEAREDAFVHGSRFSLGLMHGLSIVSGSLDFASREEGWTLEAVLAKLHCELDRRKMSAQEVLDQGTVAGLEEGIKLLEGL